MTRRGCRRESVMKPAARRNATVRRGGPIEHAIILAMAALVSGILSSATPTNVSTTEAAAATPVALLLSDGGVSSSSVRASVSLTATLTDGDGEATTSSGWAVEFRGTGDGGWRSGPIPTQNGVARYERTSPVPQRETITAAVVAAGCADVVSNTIVHDWWLPQLTIQLLRGTATNSVRVRLSHDGVGIPSQELDVLAGVAFGDRQESTRQLVTTGPDGWATTTDPLDLTPSWIEWIQVWGTGPLSWLQAVQVEQLRSPDGALWHSTFMPQYPSARVGSRVNATARFFTSNGEQDPYANRTVEWWRQPPPPDSEVWFPPETTNAQGATSRTFVENSPMFKGMYVLIRGRSVFGTVTHWWAPNLELTQQRTRSEPGQPFSTTAVLSHDGVPVANSTVRFTITNADGLPTITETTTTDPNGLAVVSWTRPRPTTDTITASELDQVGAATTQQPSTHTWAATLAPPLDMSINRSVGSGRAGTPTTIAAAIQADGTELAGIPVTLTDSTGTVLGRADTDTEGRARITYTSHVTGVERIFAAAAVVGCRVDSSLTITRWLPILEVKAPTAATPGGRPATITARLRNGSTGVAGAVINFTSHSTNCQLPDLTGRATTNNAGVATIQFTRRVPSVDSITAVEATTGDDPQRDGTAHTWGRAANPTLKLSLKPSSSNSESVTPCCSALPSPTADPQFEGLKSPLPEAMRATITLPLTGPDGTTTYSYKSSEPTTDKINGTAVAGCDESLPSTINHEWWVPELSLAPTRATLRPNTAARVTASLRHANQTVPGQIRFTITNAADTTIGPISASQPTADGGSLEWTRTKPGVDTIQVTEVADIRPATATATYTWENAPNFSLDATPEASSGSIEDPFTVRVSTFLDGELVDGIGVRLRATMPGQPDVEQTAISVSGGVAEFTYRRNVAGIDNITVAGRFNGDALTKSLTRTWVIGPTTPTSPSSPIESPSSASPSPDPSSTSPTSEPSATPPSSTASSSPSPTPTVDKPDQTPGPQSGVGTPGGSLQVDGVGCRPGQTVTVYLGTTRLGSARADRKGRYHLSTVVPTYHSAATNCVRAAENPLVTSPSTSPGPAPVQLQGGSQPSEQRQHPLCSSSC